MPIRLFVMLLLVLSSALTPLVDAAKPVSQSQQQPPPSQGEIRTEERQAPEAKNGRRQPAGNGQNGQGARGDNGKAGANTVKRQPLKPWSSPRGKVTPPRQTDVPRIESGVLPTTGARARQAANAGERYIVTLKTAPRNSRSVMNQVTTEIPGVTPTHIYSHVLSGFAAYLTPEARRALEQDQSVAAITPDRQVFLADQKMPPGIDRIDADLSPVANINGGDDRVDADIAIIDTGLDLTHPDLNLYAYTDCTSPRSTQNWGWDLEGHGTHVAGITAALDNGIGVVGVAPGARLWSLRVADDYGDIYDSYLIACLDLVTTPYNGQSIDVVNMSLGGSSPYTTCSNDAFHQAVCNVVNAGVTVVVAAGNDAENAASSSPANFPEVITVSALADADGKPGRFAGNYQPTCRSSRERDDSLASFSNFGIDVDIAAPGVGVLSTYPTYMSAGCTGLTGYNVLTGTSMASPHVAGGAALVKAAHGSYSPAQIKTALLANREYVALPGDPDGINEGVLNVRSSDGGGSGDITPPNVSLRAASKAKTGKWFNLTVSVSDPSGISRIELYSCTPNCRLALSDASAPWAYQARAFAPGRISYFVRAYDGAGNQADSAKKTVMITKAKKK